MVSHTKPNTSILERAQTLTIWDSNEQPVSFGNILNQPDSNINRTLVVFIRHFFCGNCQEYVRRLSTNLSPSTLPANLSIVIVGCGAASLISSYREITSCPFPIYADPSTQLYKLLGMQRSLSLGPKGPEYIQHSLVAGMMKSVVQGVKRIPLGDVNKGGDLSVNGGEFLLVKDENSKWKISWSHCMLNSRDHTEVNVLKQQLHINNSDETLNARGYESDETLIASVDTPLASKFLCQEPCSLQSEPMEKALPNPRDSWIAKAGRLTRSSSIRNSMLHLS